MCQYNHGKYRINDVFGNLWRYMIVSCYLLVQIGIKCRGRNENIEELLKTCLKRYLRWLGGCLKEGIACQPRYRRGSGAAAPRKKKKKKKKKKKRWRAYDGMRQNWACHQHRAA